MRTITARFSAILAVLAMAFASLALTASPSSADGTDNYVQLDPVYAGGSYTLQSLLGYVPDSYTQPQGVDDNTKIVDNNGNPLLKVGYGDEDNTISWYADHDGTTYYIDLPVYVVNQNRNPKRLPDHFVTKNYYHDPIMVKWQDDVSGKTTKVPGLIAPGKSKTINVRKAKVINGHHVIWAYYFVKFRGQTIQVETLGFKVSHKKHK